MSKLKKSNINSIKLILLITSICYVSCKNKMKEFSISTHGHIERKLDSTRFFTNFTILETFPAFRKCDSKKVYANLYITKEWKSGDTVYIFEECEGVNNIATDSSNTFPIALSKESIRPFKDNAIIFTPASLKIANNADFIFAKVGFMTEY